MRKLFNDSKRKAIATVATLGIVALIPLGALFFGEPTPSPGEEGSGDTAEISRMMDELRANSNGSKFAVEKYLGGTEK